VKDTRFRDQGGESTLSDNNLGYCGGGFGVSFVGRGSGLRPLYCGGKETVRALLTGCPGTLLVAGAAPEDAVCVAGTAPVP